MAQERTHQIPKQGGGGSGTCENDIDTDRHDLFIAQLAVLFIMCLDDRVEEGSSWKASPNCYKLQKVGPEGFQNPRSGLVDLWLREGIGRLRYGPTALRKHGIVAFRHTQNL